MIVDIVSDTICPWCFIGKRRLERALTLLPQAELEVRWHPFQLNPDMPRGGMERSKYLRLKFGDERGADAYHAVREAGAGEGIEFNFPGILRTPNTLDSHRLLRYAAELGLQHQVVEGLFQAYFVDGRDIGDGLTLLEVGAVAGLERGPLAEYLESEAGRAEVAEEDRMARRMGVEGVPCFVFQHKYVVSGAQAPEVFTQVFELVNRELAEGDAAARPQA